MYAWFDRLFLKHPRSVDENYWEHLVFASGFSSKLILAGLAALIHAILPYCFEKTASNLIRDMHERLHNR